MVALAGAGVVPGLKKLALCLLIGDVGIRMVEGVGVYREGDDEEDDVVGIDQGIANWGAGCWMFGIVGGGPAIAGLMAYVSCQQA